MSEPLVLLAGMMCDARLFAPQVAAVSHQRTVVHPALIGADTVAGLAERVLDEAPPRFALAGLSMGGIVAMEIAHQAPDRIDRLALLDTNPLAEAAEMRARRGPQIEKVRAGRLRAVMRDELKPNYLADTAGREAILDLCMEMAEALGPEVFERQSRALRDRPDRQEALRALAVPTLLLCGAGDRLCPPERHRLMQRLMPHATLTIIDGAGHLPVLEQPETTNAALRRWLED